MRSSTLGLAVALAICPCLAGVAFAQEPPGEPSGGAAPAGNGNGNGAAPAASGSAAKPAGEIGGYAYSDHPAAAHQVARTAPVRVYHHASGPIATLPGFEETSDGGSRLFVQLTQQVPVEQRAGAAGTLTYVLKGAHINRWNNTNALVTVHFNTPVSRARLVPQGSDLLFIVDLRAAVSPTFKVTEAPNHTATLAIDFPKGDYLDASGPVTTATTDAAPAPPPRRMIPTTVKRKNRATTTPAPAPAPSTGPTTN